MTLQRTVVHIFLHSLMCLLAMADFVQYKSERPIWLIQVGHNFGGYEYMNPEQFSPYHLQGFHLDLINAVCTAGDLDCRTVLDTYDNCWNTSDTLPSPGKGLMTDYYDACIGWAPTIPRIQSFRFSKSYAVSMSAHFYLAGSPADASRQDFNVNDISRKKIAFLRGWPADLSCLQRLHPQGQLLTRNNSIFASSIEEIKELLKNGKADAVFIEDAAVRSEVRHEHLSQVSGHPFLCQLDGLALMARKDNAFIKHWDQAFQTILSDGTYKELCSDALENHRHHGEIDCLDV